MTSKKDKMEEFLDSMILKHRTEGTRVYVTTASGKHVATYDTLAISKDYFRMSNDVFYDTYGFNRVPEEPYYTQAKKLVERERAHDSRFR